jgi:hypothetical protein
MKRICLSKRMGGLGLLLMVAGLAACDSLLEVTNPGSVVAEDLDDPRLAETLVLGAVADFECVYDNHVEVMGFWAGEFYATDNAVWLLEPMHRMTQYWETRWGDGTCEEERATHNGLQTARTQAVTAQTLIAGFDDIDADHKEFLLGKAALYEGMSIELLGEEFCRIPINGGPPMTRDGAFAMARDKFTDAITNLSAVTGDDLAEATTLKSAALTMRARANLNLGAAAATIIADADLVPAGFKLLAKYESTPSRLYNAMYWQSSLDYGVVLSYFYAPGVHYVTPVPADAELYGTIDGTPGGAMDPRVPMAHIGLGSAFDPSMDVWIQDVFDDRADDMTITSYEEAQLMIAEVDPARSVGIINALRAVHGIAAYTAVDAATTAAQVRVERIKELFLEGTRIMDKLRWNEPFAMGNSVRGQAYNASITGCVPLPDYETLTNTNF